MDRMLYHYLEHKRKESSGPLHATYLVSGKSVDKGQTVRRSQGLVQDNVVSGALAWAEDAEASRHTLETEVH